MNGAAVLTRARKRAGLTQAELARRAGTSQPVISAYEHGRRDPSIETLRRLVRAAGCRARARRSASRPRQDLPARRSTTTSAPPAWSTSCCSPTRSRTGAAPARAGLPAAAVGVTTPRCPRRSSRSIARSPTCRTRSAVRWRWPTTPSRGPRSTSTSTCSCRWRDAPGVIERLRRSASTGDAPADALERDGQVRLWWDRNPVDLFFSYDPFHDAARDAARTRPVRRHRDPGARRPTTSSCARRSSTGRRTGSTSTRCWPPARAIDAGEVLRWVSRITGPDDPRFARIARVLAA